MKRDFQRKSKVLENGLYHIWLSNRVAEYKRKGFDLFDVPFDDNFLPYLLVDMSCYSSKDIKECERLFNSRRNRVHRLKDRLKKIFMSDCVFLTLTFRDDVFETTNVETRRRYVSRFLKDFSVPYVANIDFGEENNREHYHAVLQVNSIDLNSWKYGYSFSQHIYMADKSNVSIAKYMNKLSSHAYKDSTKGFRLIYSR